VPTGTGHIDDGGMTYFRGKADIEWPKIGLRPYTLTLVSRPGPGDFADRVGTGVRRFLDVRLSLGPQGGVTLALRIPPASGAVRNWRLRPVGILAWDFTVRGLALGRAGPKSSSAGRRAAWIGRYRVAGGRPAAGIFDRGARRRGAGTACRRSSCLY